MLYPIMTTSHVSIQDEAGEIVASGTGSSGQLFIKDVHLWQPLQAYLYASVVELWQNGKCIDTYEQPFGVRTVAIKDGKFLINGKPFYFKGFGRHEDSHIHGRGLDEALNVKDLNLMKWIGANSFRTSHYPYSEELMRLADREGFVVIDEVPAVGLHLNFGTMLGGGVRLHKTWEELGTKEHHAQMIRDLIARDKNHPCVVMWSIAMEGDSRFWIQKLIADWRTASRGGEICLIGVLMCKHSSMCEASQLSSLAAAAYWAVL